MKILLLIPDANIHKLKLGNAGISFREAPLTLTSLAALVPEDIIADITIVDENIQKIPFHKHFDLVGISCLTGTAFKAYEYAELFRKKGSIVVLGGIHVTLCPEEASKHADSILIGFGERVWAQLLKDFCNGSLKKIYEDRHPPLSKIPIPRRDLQKNIRYAMPDTIMATRGCQKNCDFCSVPAAGYGWDTRPVEEVIDEITSLKRKRFTFSDVNLLNDRNYAMELLEALIPVGKKWGALANISIGEDIEMLEMLERAGCQYLLVGMESISNASIASINKSESNNSDNYYKFIEAFHEYGIVIQACLIFGLDHDDKDVFSNTVDVVNDLKIDIPRFAINTPYPGTGVFERFKKEGRLLHRHWPHYDTQHVVFQPANMSPEELDSGFIKAYEETFSLINIKSRMLFSPHPLITLVGNLAYRRYSRHLRKKKDRIIQPSFNEKQECLSFQINFIEQEI